MREPVAFGAGGERSAGDLLRDAAKVAAQLTAAEGEAQLLIAIGRDRYAFAAALLGTWARGYCAAITPHTGRDAIIASAPHCAAVIHDGVTSAPLRIDELLAGEDVGPLALSLPDRLVLLYREDRDGSWITSSKRRHQLLDEAAVLVASFELGRGLRYANTLPIGEPYGFMLGLLVPLISGGAFQREVSNTATDEPADVLVSAPRQLRRMRERKRFAQLFSAPTLETEEPKLQPQLERLESKLAGISGVEDFLVVAVADELFALLVASTRSEAELAAEVAGFDGAGTNLARVARLPRFGDDRASRARLLQHFRRDADGRPLSFQLAWRDERVLDEGEQRRR
ncbi:MAG TPA: hypothetical protein VGI70_17955, partial [Polyangiales bacterium]